MVYSDAALRPRTPRITDVPQSHREQEILLPNIFTPIIYFWCHCCKIQRLHHYYSLHSYHSCIESQWWEARCLRGCSWWEVDIVGHGVCWAELGARVSAVRRPGPGPNTAPCHGRTIHHNPGCRTAPLSLLYSPALYRLELYSDHNLSSFLYLYSYYFLCFRLTYFFFQIVWKWIEQFKLCLLDQWPVDHIHSTAQWCTVQYCTVQWTSPPIGLQSVPRWPAPGHHAALSSRLCTPVQHKYYGHVTDMLGRTCKLWCYELVSKINRRNHLLSPASGHSGNCR